MVNRKIPKIRFKHFGDGWKSDKLGNLGTVAMNKRIFKEETSEVGEVPFYKIGTFGGKPDSFITRDKFEEYKSKYPYPKIGDILISASGSIGRTVEYQGEEAYFQDSNIVWLKHDGRIDNSFLKHFYAIVKWQGVEGTTIKRLYNKNILETPITLPSISEQSAIGSLFCTLDDLLASYKDNLANYQALKVTMLSKMFPKAGQTVPEIRLDGFEGEWVEKRLKDISKRVTRKNNDLVSERALTISAQFGLIDQEEFFQKKIASKDVSGYYLIKKGEFAYNKSYSTGYPLGAIKRLDKYENGVLSTLYILFKAVDVDSDYLAHYYESDKWHREVSMCAAEGARNHGLLNITPVDFFNTRLVVPKELEEQRAIGSYFSNLDNLINSHQEKITQLENLKKKLLQDMFI
ncbi:MULTISPECIES: restriction endonuclease subunit S [Streptococcus]|jgi:sau1hsdS1|uniref:restriction endonuclease subunit S n=1 Tax=Streptococcus TaxID=1301 RepID=UPI0018A0A4AB|nr:MULTISPECIES: restriction endonuclease subunit S [Streptococcus]MBK5081115.1 restriction endonuclease subunit S [Streptococcus sp. 10.1]MBK5158843.1 restriction endonuclease subunit S [Streptococcus sp. 9.1]MDB8593492.1 restriction endonuclease subunit S [Streptococcus salivarius]MDB8595840.1 restriction endonuclease subunit S [Streptococcus salivarius]MDB8600604.1 restriction endonuclease subunit S [Streptococcus salivarius]